MWAWNERPRAISVGRSVETVSRSLRNISLDELVPLTSVSAFIHYALERTMEKSEQTLKMYASSSLVNWF